MKKYYKIEVYGGGKWFMTRFLSHQNFSNLNDARYELNGYSSPTRIVEVSETVVEIRNSLNKEDLIKLLEDHTILVTENCDMYRVYSIHPTEGEFKLKTPNTCSLWIFSLEEGYINNGKLNIKDISGKCIEFSYYKNISL
jgi:hypothetical protein